MPNSKYFDENEWLKEEYLWPLRQQVELDGVFESQFENTYCIDPADALKFFDDFWMNYTERLAEEDGLYQCAIDECQDMTGYVASKEQADAWYIAMNMERYDNEPTLKAFYRTFSANPLPPRKFNVDIRWEFHRSIMVIANSEDEAKQIVDKMMCERQIPLSTFEPDDNWELDTTYQPPKEIQSE